jgi:hypothetical protein
LILGEEDVLGEQMSRGRGESKHGSGEAEEESAGGVDAGAGPRRPTGSGQLDTGERGVLESRWWTGPA